MIEIGTELATLIDQVKVANGWTDPDLVRNAARHGHELTKSNISRYRNERPLISIKGEIVLALAAGLDTSPSRIAEAAIRSMGIPMAQPESVSAESAIGGDISLSTRDREILLSTLARMRVDPEPTANRTKE